MNCPKDGKPMICEDTDYRGEWSREEYFCEECDKTYSRLMNFSQDGLITSDEWENYNPDNEKEFTFIVPLIGIGENEEEAWTAVVQELDGFDKSELSDLNVQSVTFEEKI